MKHSLNNKVLLLAGGVGTRLKPLTDITPKCLAPIAGRPLLDYWFDSFARSGIREVMINTHHLPEPVRRFIDEKNATGQYHVVETYEPKLLGSAGTIHANRAYADDADVVVIIYADNLSNVDLTAMVEYHRSHDDPLTMLLFHHPLPKQAGIVELDEARRIVSFVEKPEQPKSDLANAGVYVVDADAYREIVDMNAFDLGFDVLPRFVGRMRGYVFDGYHRDIGTLKALKAADSDAPHVFRRPAAFLDRDGTIIEHVHHLTDPARVKLIDGAADALRQIRQAGYLCVVVTNQSVIGRGMLTHEGLDEIHRVMNEQLDEQGVKIDAIYSCPEPPRRGDATVIEHPDRKPGPGMLQRAARELNLDLSRSWMIGDSISDVLAGRNAGCRGSILVRTGVGHCVDGDHEAIDYEAKDLYDAARIILGLPGSSELTSHKESQS